MARESILHTNYKYKHTQTVTTTIIMIRVRPKHHSRQLPPLKKGEEKKGSSFPDGFFSPLSKAFFFATEYKTGESAHSVNSYCGNADFNGLVGGKTSKNKKLHIIYCTNLKMYHIKAT